MARFLPGIGRRIERFPAREVTDRLTVAADTSSIGLCLPSGVSAR